MQSFMQNIDSIKMRVEHGTSMCPQKSYPFMIFKCGLLFNKIPNMNKVFSLMQTIEYLKAENKLTQNFEGHLLSFVYQNPKMYDKIQKILDSLIRNTQINILIELQKLQQSLQQDSKLNQMAIQTNQAIKQDYKNGSNQAQNHKLTRNGTAIIESQKKDNKVPQQSNTQKGEHKDDRKSDLEDNQSDKTQKYDDDYLQNMIKMNMESEALAKKLQEEQQQLAKQSKPDAEIVCEVCYVGLYDEQFVPLENCQHIFHKNCLAEYYKAQISQNRFPLKCPNDTCKMQAKDSDIKQILASQMYNKYEKHTLKHYADMHGDSISWCPTANCQYMFFFEKDDSARFQCLECKKQYCLNCRSQWHKDMSCKEYQITNTHSTADDAFMKFVTGKKFKQCPKCKFWVEKNQGCDHMTCKCKFQFCYKCGGVYGKCQCMAKMQEQMERRRLQIEERRRKKQQQIQKRKKKLQSIREVPEQVPERRTRRNKR